MKNTKDKIKRIKVDTLYGKKKRFNAADQKRKTTLLDWNSIDCH